MNNPILILLILSIFSYSLPIYLVPKSSNIGVFENELFIVTCHMNYSEDTKYASWFHIDSRNKKSHVIKKHSCQNGTTTMGDKTSIRLSFQNIKLSDSGVYYCQYFNESFHSKININVFKKIKTKYNLINYLNVTEGEEFKLTCEMIFAGNFKTLSLNWQFNNVTANKYKFDQSFYSVRNLHDNSEIATSVLKTNHVTRNLTGSYKCIGLMTNK